MRRTAITGLALGIGLALTAGPALAAEKSDGRGEGLGRFQRLKLLDTDRDGAVSPAEFAKQQAERFARRDGNKDGRLGPDEVEFVRGGRGNPETRADKLIKRYDANADERVTKEEFEAGTRAWFAKRDTNGDGKLSAAEAPRRFARRGGRGDPPSLDAMLERSALRFKGLDANGDGAFDAAEIAAVETARREYRVKRAMKRLDGNGDGSVTSEEFMATAQTRFSRLDLDSDGKITAADLPPEVRVYWTAP